MSPGKKQIKKHNLFCLKKDLAGEFGEWCWENANMDEF